ncbi:hypothetical protein ACH4VM_23510 [Streptomyces sp. NPDC020792]|uniref:hypothetical protein n=1 Tax=Streptomyces sp. NPDC020792 TaxID=3365089 RepID=UPI00378E792D
MPGFPEYVDADVMLTSREVLAWDVQPAAVLAAEATPGLPVAVGSDVRCGALGKARHGVGRDLPDFFYVSLGTRRVWHVRRPAPDEASLTARCGCCGVHGAR